MEFIGIVNKSAGNCKFFLFIKEIFNGKRVFLYTGTQYFKRQPHKMVKHTQTICWEIADELFECVSPFCRVGA